MKLSAIDSTPVKGKVYCLTSAIETVQASQPNFEPEQKCSICGSTKINLVRMPSHSTHYAARRCAGCDAFRGWQPKPETQEKRLSQQTAISQLLKSSQLSQWEREFLTSLQGKRSLSPKQQETLGRIEAKVGGLL